MLRISNTLFHKAALAAGLVLSVTVAGDSSALINYGNFSDIPPGTVTYTNVRESSVTDPVPPGPALYGPPAITGNLLDFDPTAFGANSAGAGGFDLMDGQLNFEVVAAAGTSIDTLFVSEGGDYSFTGVTPDIGTFVSAGVTTQVTVLEVDNVVLGVPIVILQNDNFSIDYLSEGKLPNTNTSGLQFWALNYNIDILGALSGNHVLGATKIEVAINNQLSTTTTTGNQAFIAKKDFSINVPEPTSLALLGLGGLLVMRRRRDR